MIRALARWLGLLDGLRLGGAGIRIPRSAGRAVTLPRNWTRPRILKARLAIPIFVRARARRYRSDGATFPAPNLRARRTGHTDRADHQPHGLFLHHEDMLDWSVIVQVSGVATADVHRQRSTGRVTTMIVADEPVPLQESLVLLRAIGGVGPDAGTGVRDSERCPHQGWPVVSIAARAPTPRLCGLASHLRCATHKVMLVSFGSGFVTL